MEITADVVSWLARCGSERVCEECASCAQCYFGLPGKLLYQDGAFLEKGDEAATSVHQMM